MTEGGSESDFENFGVIAESRFKFKIFGVEVGKKVVNSESTPAHLCGDWLFVIKIKGWRLIHGESEELRNNNSATIPLLIDWFHYEKYVLPIYPIMCDKIKTANSAHRLTPQVQDHYCNFLRMVQIDS